MRYRAEDFQKDFWVNIGKRIRLRREQFGLTRDQLSYEIGVSEKTLGQIERGEHGCSVARLFMIASKLNISVDRLLKGTPQETLLPASSSRERIDLLLEGRPEIQLDSIYHVLLSIVPYLPLDEEGCLFLCISLSAKMMKRSYWFLKSISANIRLGIPPMLSLSSHQAKNYCKTLSVCRQFILYFLILNCPVYPVLNWPIYCADNTPMF